MILTNHLPAIPPYKQDGLGPHQNVVTIPDGFGGTTTSLAIWGTMVSTDSWKDRPFLSSKAKDYPVLFSEGSVDCLNNGKAPFSGSNPVLRLPTRPWGKAGTLLRVPNTLLFTDIESVMLGFNITDHPIVIQGSSTGFVASLSTVLDKYNVIATNKTRGGSIFPAASALAEHLVFDSMTTSSVPPEFPGPDDPFPAGVVNPDTFLAGKVYEISVSYFFNWLEKANGGLFHQTVAPVALNNHYVAQQQAAYPKYAKRKRVSIYLDFGDGDTIIFDGVPYGLNARLGVTAALPECQRAIGLLGAQGFDAPIVVTKSGSGAWTFDVASALSGLATDIEAFFRDD